MFRLFSFTSLKNGNKFNLVAINKRWVNIFLRQRKTSTAVNIGRCTHTHTHTHTHTYTHTHIYIYIYIYIYIQRERERERAVSVFSYNLKSLLEWPEFFLGFCSRFCGKLSVWKGCEVFCYLSGQFASLLFILCTCLSAIFNTIEEHHRIRCGGIIENGSSGASLWF